MHVTVNAENPLFWDEAFEFLDKLSGVASFGGVFPILNADGKRISGLAEDLLRTRLSEIVDRSPLLERIDIRDAVSIGFKRVYCYLGEPQHSWIRKDEGRDSVFLEPYKGML